MKTTYPACTCHPHDRVIPCARRYANTECVEHHYHALECAALILRMTRAGHTAIQALKSARKEDFDTYTIIYATRINLHATGEKP